MSEENDHERKYEEAKAELNRFMESGGTMEELEQFIKRAWGNFEMMTAIVSLLFQHSNAAEEERDVGD